MTSIVFMGTPEFSAPILESLIENGYDVKAVMTQPDRLVGRKRLLTQSPVKKVAVKHGIDVLQPEKLSGSDEMAKVIAMEPDFLVTAAFGQFLPTKLLEAAKIGAINVHGSLLPKYRGGAPIQYAIMNGEQETGITIIYMVKKMDAGNIISRRAIKIENNDDSGSMFEKLSLLGKELLLETLPKLIDGTSESTPQNEDEVSFSPTIKSEEEALDFSKTANEVDWKIRSLRPVPGAYTSFKGKRTKIWDVTVLDEKTDLSVGQVVEVTKKSLKIACGKGTVVAINTLQPNGKSKQTIVDYLNGSGQGIKEGQQVIDV
ncbi:methionyl-tRNA formyltransferase [Dellaglioa sp. BT-FLS60]